MLANSCRETLNGRREMLVGATFLSRLRYECRSDTSVAIRAVRPVYAALWSLGCRLCLLARRWRPSRQKCRSYSARWTFNDFDRESVVEGNSCGDSGGGNMRRSDIVVGIQDVRPGYWTLW